MKTLVLFFATFLGGFNADTAAELPNEKKVVITSSNNLCEVPFDFDFKVDGLTVKFIPKNIEEFDLLEWHFGDGSISTDVSPEYTYTETGKYSFSVKATDVDEDCFAECEGHIFAFEL
ncbi:MAG: PKD domain-containing protein [Chitinophagales bacterium]